MKNSLFSSGDYHDIVNRINKLSPDSKNEWGKMTVNEMICHISDPFRDVLAMRISKPAIPFLLRPLMKPLVLSQKPWKKNLKTFRVYLQGEGGGGTKPTDFENDRKTLLDVLNKFSSVDKNFQFGNHGGLGKLSREENGF